MADTTAARQARVPGSENESSSGTISNVTESIKEKASDFSQRVSGAIDEQKQTAAGALTDAASRLHESAEKLPGGGRVTSIAHTAADKLEQTSQYIRENDMSAMMQDAVEWVKRYPTQAIVSAAVAGFLVGRLFKRD